MSFASYGPPFSSYVIKYILPDAQSCEDQSYVIKYILPDAQSCEDHDAI